MADFPFPFPYCRENISGLAADVVGLCLHRHRGYTALSAEHVAAGHGHANQPRQAATGGQATRSCVSHDKHHDSAVGVPEVYGWTEVGDSGQVPGQPRYGCDTGARDLGHHGLIARRRDCNSSARRRRGVRVGKTGQVGNILSLSSPLLRRLNCLGYH